MQVALADDPKARPAQQKAVRPSSAFNFNGYKVWAAEGIAKQAPMATKAGKAGSACTACFSFSHARYLSADGLVDLRLATLVAEFSNLGNTLAIKGSVLAVSYAPFTEVIRSIRLLKDCPSPEPEALISQ